MKSMYRVNRSLSLVEFKSVRNITSTICLIQIDKKRGE